MIVKTEVKQKPICTAKSVTSVWTDNESRDCTQYQNYFWLSHELIRLGGKRNKSDWLNENLILWEDLMAKKMLAASEFSLCDTQMKVVYCKLLPVVLEGTCWITACTGLQQEKAFLM